MTEQYVRIENREELNKLNEKLKWIRKVFHTEYVKNDFPLYIRFLLNKDYIWFSQSSIEAYSIDDSDIGNMKNSISVEDYLKE